MVHEPLTQKRSYTCSLNEFLENLTLSSTLSRLKAFNMSEPQLDPPARSTGNKRWCNAQVEVDKRGCSEAMQQMQNSNMHICSLTDRLYIKDGRRDRDITYWFVELHF